MAERAFLPRRNGFRFFAERSAFCLAALLLAAAAPVTPERAAELEHMVLQDCGSCHGLTRRGGLGSPLTAEALAGATPEGLALIILEGVPGTAMPPWRPLISEADAAWMADYLLKDTE